MTAPADTAALFERSSTHDHRPDAPMSDRTMR